MKDILVIFTGGTIGSKMADGYISSNEEAPFTLLQMYEKEKHGEVLFFTKQPYTLLSENLTARIWTLLYDCIAEAIRERDYDGIIITHGSDTLQYTGAVMGYAFATTTIPIFLVASNYILEDKRANGFANFCAAITCIEKGYRPGVFIPYRNGNGTVYLHEAVKTIQHQSYADELYSVENQYLATIEAKKVQNNKDFEAKAMQRKDLPVPEEDTRAVLRIFSYPGMQYELPDWNRYGAILIDTYHSGTLCSKAMGFEAFLQAAKENDVPVFVTGAGNEIEYSSVTEWKQKGVYVLPKASPLAMYCKAWMLLTAGMQGKELADAMYIACAGEF